MNKDLLEVGCNVGVANLVLQGKWKFAIIHYLAQKTMRFGELSRALPNIRQGYLTKQLRELENDGIVHREVYREVPPKVEYSLTKIGRDLEPVTKAMEEWGRMYTELVRQAVGDEESLRKKK